MNETVTLSALEIEANNTIEASPDAPTFRTFTADSVFDAAPPLEFVIGEGMKGLITKASVNLLVGEPGSKKTWAALDMAVCVSMGRNWLDFATCQAPVLIVDEESGQRRLKRRLLDVLSGHLVKREDAPQITCMSLQQFDARNIDHINALHVMILQTGAGLVIVDALADIMPGADENSVKDVMPAMMNLRKLAESTQAAIIVIHHNNKQTGSYRGSTAIKGAVDLMLSVESAAAAKFITFDATKARDIEPQKFTAVITFAPNQVYLTATDINPRATTSKPQREVLDFLLEHDNATVKEIAENSIAAMPTIRAAIYSLAPEYVERTNEGTGRGINSTFSLNSKGRDFAKGVG